MEIELNELFIALIGVFFSYFGYLQTSAMSRINESLNKLSDTVSLLAERVARLEGVHEAGRR